MAELDYNATLLPSRRPPETTGAITKAAPTEPQPNRSQPAAAAAGGGGSCGAVSTAAERSRGRPRAELLNEGRPWMDGDGDDKGTGTKQSFGCSPLRLVPPDARSDRTFFSIASCETSPGTSPETRRVCSRRVRGHTAQDSVAWSSL